MSWLYRFCFLPPSLRRWFARGVPRKADDTRPWLRNTQSAAIEMAAGLPILESLAQQLRESSAYMERSVIELCQSFQGMAQRARHLATQAASNGRDANFPGGQELVGTVRTNILHLLDHLQQASVFSSQIAERTRNLRSDLRRVEECLGNVTCLARQAKLVALNGRIEASRAGEHGSAFGVVAQETNDFAVHAVDTSEMIRAVVEGLSTTLSRTSDELDSRAQVDTAEHLRTNDNTTNTLNLLQDYQAQLHARIVDSQRASEALSHDIRTAIVALQFQDTVGQRIAHVIETLEALLEAWRPVVSHVSRHQTAKRVADWQLLMKQQYTMNSERLVDSDVDAAELVLTSSEPGSVELF